VALPNSWHHAFLTSALKTRLRAICAFVQTSLKCVPEFVELSSLRMTRKPRDEWLDAVVSIERGRWLRFTPGLICPYRFLDFCDAHGRMRRPIGGGGV
jgi:hypothetical protein